MRILIVDQNNSARMNLKSVLEAQGYDVVEASHASEALKSVASLRLDMVILDVVLPDMDDGLVIKKIREKSNVPIIVISSRDKESDKIAALDAGADDYLGKPFRPGETLARIRAVTRRVFKETKGNIFKSGDLSVDIVRRVVSVNARRVHLTPIEFDILKVFILHAGNVVTHKILLKEVWNKTEDFEGIAHLLRVMISNLRNKIEANPKKPVYILTIPGIGYRLHVLKKDRAQEIL